MTRRFATHGLSFGGLKDCEGTCRDFGAQTRLVQTSLHRDACDDILQVRDWHWLPQMGCGMLGCSSSTLP